MDKNTLYIYDYKDQIIEINIHYEKKHIISCNKMFNELCLKEFTTLKGRIDAIKKVFSFAYNVPIFINPNMIFFKLSENVNIWINALNVLDIKKKANNTIIIFNNGKILETKKNYRTVKNSYSKILDIINYKNGFI